MKEMLALIINHKEVKETLRDTVISVMKTKKFREKIEKELNSSIEGFGLRLRNQLDEIVNKSTSSPSIQIDDIIEDAVSGVSTDKISKKIEDAIISKISDK